MSNTHWIFNSVNLQVWNQCYLHPKFRCQHVEVWRQGAELILLVSSYRTRKYLRGTPCDGRNRTKQSAEIAGKVALTDQLRCLFMIVEYFIPSLSVHPPLAGRNVLSSGMWSVQVSGFYTEKQEMRDRTGQLLKIYVLWSLHVHPETFRCNWNIFNSIYIYHSKFHPQNQKNIWTSSDVCVLISFCWKWKYK